MKKIFIFSFTLFIAGCKPEIKPIEYFTAIKNMRWLEGAWQGEYQGKPFYEKWEVVNDTTFQNYALKFETGDSTAEHNGQIRVIDGQVFYTNDPKGDEKLLKWALADCNEQRVRFENPTAPYSRTIIFEHTPKDEWRATLIMNKDTVKHLLHRIDLTNTSF